MRATLALAACLGALSAAPAQADRWRRLDGGAFLHYELSGWRAYDDDAMRASAPREVILAGARLHGFVSRNRWLAYHVGIDLAAGSTLGEAGFAYDVALFPVGVVLRLGERSIVGLGAGIGASGAVGTLDDAAALPVELTAELGAGIRVLARARATWLGGTGAARQGGAPSLGAGLDELDAMLGLRIGRRYRKWGLASGNGYFVGASYREQQDGRFVGITIGYSIDLAMARRREEY